MPLLPMQNNFLWHSLKTRNHTDVIQLRCTFEGVVDLQLLQQAWNLLVSREQVLRSSVHWEKTPSPIQLIHKHVDSSIVIIDQEIFPTLDAYRHHDQHQHIDLTQAPAYRVAIYEQASDRCDIVWSMSHVLVDGWSSAIVINDWVDIYSKLLKGDAFKATNGASWSDYIRWFKQQDPNQNRQYWDNYLPDSAYIASRPPLLEMAPSSATMRSVTSQLGDSQFEELKSCLTSTALSLNTVLQASFAVITHAKGANDSVLFGTTVSGRHIVLPRMDERIGMMTNMVPVCVPFEQGITVNDWLDKIQQRFYASLPFTHASPTDIASLRPNLSPLYDRLLIIENQPGVLSTPEIVISNYQSAIISEFDLTLTVIPGDKLRFNFRYNDLTFDSEYIERLSNSLVSLLGNLSHHINQSLDTLTPYKAGKESQINNVDLDIQNQPGESLSATDVTTDDSTTSMLEKTIRSIWREILTKDTVNLDDNFFDLGGTSVQALMVFEQIEKKLNIKLPATTLFSAPTIHALVTQLTTDQPDTLGSSVISVNEKGKLPPLFIPFEQADMLMYRQLFIELGSDQPIYGLQISHDGYPSEDEFESIVRNIRTIYPSGPCLLAGLSGAGCVAWDLAQRLKQENHTVSLLVLCDSYGPAYPQLQPPITRLATVSIQALKKISLMCISVSSRSLNHLIARTLVKNTTPSESVTVPTINQVQHSQQFKQRLLNERIATIQFVNEISADLPLSQKCTNWMTLQLTRWSIRSVNMQMELIVFTQGLLLQHCRTQISLPDKSSDNDAWQNKILSLDPSAIGTNKPTAQGILTSYQNMYKNIRPYHGRILYCKAIQRPAGIIDDHLVGWEGFFKGATTISNMPGNHTSLLKAHNVSVMAKAIKDEMALAKT